MMTNEAIYGKAHGKDQIQYIFPPFMVSKRLKEVVTIGMLKMVYVSPLVLCKTISIFVEVRVADTKQ